MTGSETLSLAKEEHNKLRTCFGVMSQKVYITYSKTCVKWPLKNRQNIDLNDKWELNEGLKYCRMLPLENSAIILACIKR